MNYDRARVKVACVNWNSPDAPRAVAYLVDGPDPFDIGPVTFHPTWAEAMAQADYLAGLLRHRRLTVTTDTEETR